MGPVDPGDRDSQAICADDVAGARVADVEDLVRVEIELGQRCFEDFGVGFVGSNVVAGDDVVEVKAVVGYGSFDVVTIDV
ncbi:hypothetical protein BH09CHL1_BH09CHL1_02440 [soil metagenome]